MLALLIGFLSMITPAQHGNGSTTDREETMAADSIKLPGKHKHHVNDTGKFVQVNRIFLIGNRITRDQIINRELRVKPGDIVLESDLNEILDLDKKKLFNTRLFNKVDIRVLELDDKKVDLVVDVDERWYTFPSPIFELADRNFNEWWQNYDHDFHRVNYGLRLYQHNMRGRNETLRLLAQFGFQRKFELLYRFPYIDKKQKQGLTFDLGYLETKNLATRTFEHKYVYTPGDHILRKDRVAGITYSYRRSFYKTHSLKAEYRQIAIDPSVKLENPIYIRGEGQISLQYGSLTYQFNADHRDVVAYPLHGYQFTGTLARTGILPNDDLQRWEVSLLYSKFVDLGKNYFFANNTVGYYSDRENLSYVNFGALGLRKQFVRGYEIYIIEGSQYFLNKSTFKKRIFSHTYRWNDMPIKQFRHIPIQIYLKSYFDMGAVKNYPYYIENNINRRLADKLLMGGGFGLDIVGSYDLVLRLEYSLNGEGQHGFFLNLKKEF